MKLGTYTTFGCPCISGETLEQQKEDPKNKALLDKAFNWLESKFDKIGGEVRKVMNPHDFGEYPSFEIDYPDELEFVDVENDDEDPLAIQLKEGWEKEVQDIEDLYCTRFMK